MALSEARRRLRDNVRRIYLNLLERDPSFTKVEFARIIGRTPGSVTKLLENGQFSLDSLGDLADRLGVSIADLFAPLPDSASPTMPPARPVKIVKDEDPEQIANQISQLSRKLAEAMRLKKMEPNG